jgi:hypothetical protein
LIGDRHATESENRRAGGAASRDHPGDRAAEDISILCQEDPYLKELVRYIHLGGGLLGSLGGRWGFRKIPANGRGPGVFMLVGASKAGHEHHRGRAKAQDQPTGGESFIEAG